MAIRQVALRVMRHGETSPGQAYHILQFAERGLKRLCQPILGGVRGLMLHESGSSRNDRQSSQPIWQRTTSVPLCRIGQHHQVVGASSSSPSTGMEVESQGSKRTTEAAPTPGSASGSQGMNVDSAGAGGSATTSVSENRLVSLLQSLRDMRLSHPELLEEGKDWAEHAEAMMEDFLHVSRNQAMLNIIERGTDFPVCEEAIQEWDLGEEASYVDPQDAVYVDDLSGKVLPEDLVQEARKEEIKFVDKINLWEVVPRPSGVKVIGTRWVDVNKGDDEDFQV